MDRLTRHDLKTDKFVEEVGHTVDFIDEHRSQVARYGVVAVAVLAVAVGGWFYSQNRKSARQEALFSALQTFNARVTPTPAEGMKTFRTEAEKQGAVQKELTELAGRYSSSEEATVANYLLGVSMADQGKMDEAVRYLKESSTGSNAEYSSLAKLSLGEIYGSQGKTADAEKVLRDVVDHPTTLVTKEQASLTLARVLAKSKPDEARKLLEPLRTQSGPVSRAAIQAMSDLGLNK